MEQISKKNIVTCILLSLVTIGIYYIYWEYLLVKNIRTLRGDNSSCVGEMLCLVLVPFYALYWWYTRGEEVKRYFVSRSQTTTGSGVLYLILAIFGLGIVDTAIMQNDFNSLN